MYILTVQKALIIHIYLKELISQEYIVTEIKLIRPACYEQNNIMNLLLNHSLCVFDSNLMNTGILIWQT